MPLRLVEVLRRRSRWLTGAALLALAPKCLLCLAAYAGLGAALGLAEPELCGAANESPSRWLLVLTIPAVGLGVGCYLAQRRRRRRNLPA